MKEKTINIKHIHKKFFIYMVLFIVLLGLCLFAKLSINSSFGADNQDIETKVNLEKYINFKISDEDKGTLVQYNVKTGMKYQGEDAQSKPIKQSQIKIELNKIDEKYPYDVKVITKSTEMTNGNKQIANKNYQYNSETGTLIIGASNENENNELINSEKIKNNANDEYLVIAYYDTYIDKPEERELSIKIGATVVLNEEDRIVSHEEKFKGKVTNNIGELTSVAYSTDEIYNGYIKSNIINGTSYNTQYNEKQSIVISKKDAQETLELVEDNTFVKTENDQENDLGNNGKLVYKSTKIRKEDIVNLLGEQGKLEILDRQGNILFTIDEDTQYQEDGTVLINYENNIESIVLKTSNIQNIGILELENIKEIKSSMTEVVDAKIRTTSHIAGVNTEIINDEQIKKASFINKFDNLIDIKDAKSSINFKINNQKWSNKEQNEIIFDVCINSNTIKDNMLKNPIVKIELPDEVEKVILHNSSLTYANGLQLQDPYLDNNEEGKLVIVANLLGNQTQYDENQLGLVTDLRIAATVILKKDIENTKEKINLIYTNDYTLNEKTEKINKDYDIDILSYNSKTPILEEQTREITNELQTDTQTTEIEGLELEVTPVKGDTVLKDGDIVYEGEFIKYNIKVTNTTDRQIDNVKVIGTIPEGTVYGELKANYNDYMGEYKYNFDTSIRTKEINVGTLKSGENYCEFYEVRVSDLDNDITDIQIQTNIKTYVNNVECNTYSIENNINKADVKLFLGAFLDNGEDRWNYSLKVESEENRNVQVKLKFPEFYKLKLRVSAGDQTGTPTLLEVNEDHTLIDTIETNKEYWYEGTIDSSEVRNKYDSQGLIFTAVASTEVEGKEYTSNENRIEYEFRDVSITMTSENEGEEVNYEDEINYEIVVKNNGKTNYNSGDIDSIAIDVQDYLPEEVNPVSMEYEYWEIEENDENEQNKWVKKIESKNIKAKTKDKDGNKLPNIDLTLNIPYNEQIIIKVKTTAGDVSEKTRIENKAIVKMDERIETETLNVIQRTKISNIITHTILPYDNGNYNDPEEDIEPTDDDSEKPLDPDNPKEDEKHEDKGEDLNEKYSISGVAWVDENRDGKRQDSEERIKGINIVLVNIQDSKIIQKDISTSIDGGYLINNMDNGKYIILFKYDTQQYSLTEYQKNDVPSNINSDVSSKQITLNGENVLLGATDVIDLNTSISNIDIGLIKNNKCDLKLDKYISKVSVNTNNGTKQYSYNNEKLAKVEIKDKEINGATVVVEYKIVVTNEGEVPTVIDEVVDYIPEGLTFSSELNRSWVMQKNNKLINNSFSNTTITAGESIELSLILTKQMSQNSTGQYVNIAEIGGISNSLGILDGDSTPGNKDQKEDDYSEATLILSISTGGIIIFGSIIFGILVVLTLIVLNKKGILKLTKFRKAFKLTVFALIFSSILLANSNVFGERITIAPDPLTFWFDWQNPGYYNYYGSTWFKSPTNGWGALCQNAGVAAASGSYDFDGATSLVNSGDRSATSSDISLTKKDWENGVNIKESTDNYYIYGPLKINCTAQNVESGIRYDVKIWTKEYTNKEKTETRDIEIEDGYNICNSNGNISTLSGTGEKTFYIKVQKSKAEMGISKIKLIARVNGTTEKSTKKAGYCYYEYSPYYQEIKTISRHNAYEDTEEEEIGVEDDVTWTTFNINLNIKKVDENDNEKLLNNVEFYLKGTSYPYFGTRVAYDASRIYNENTNPEGDIVKGCDGKYYIRGTNVRYLKLLDGVDKYGNDSKGYSVDSAGNYKEWVSSKEEATVFKTGEGGNNPGECNIKNLRANILYYFVEKDNPNYGYDGNNGKTIHYINEIDGAGINYFNTSGKIYELYMLNQKNTGNLFINKKDADTNRNLEGVEFTIKATKKSYINTNYGGKTEEGDIDYIEGDKYLKIKTATEGNKGSYKGTVHITDMEFTTDKENATRFITDSNGKIKIYNILKGYYDVEEVSVGDNNWQYDIDDNYISSDFHTYHHIDYYTITDNQRKILNYFGFNGYKDRDVTKEEINLGKSAEGKVAHIRVTRRASVNTPTSGEAQYERNKTYEELIFKNRKKYVKISGYAFEDALNSKNDSRNNLYFKDTSEEVTQVNDDGETSTVNSSDRKLEGIKTVLHIVEDGKDKEIQVTRTNANGEYLFDSYTQDGETNKIEIDQLKNMYVEFQYNGMGYEVTKIVENPENIKDNSTHVVENKTKNSGKLTREQFNDKYATIGNNKAISADDATTNLYYNTRDHISRLKYNNTWTGEGKPPVSDINLYDNFIMTANTDDVHESKTYDGKPYILGLRITEEDIRKMTGEDEDTIKNINLGLYEREHPDIAIDSDVKNIKIAINGKNHLYEYNQVEKNEEYDGTKLGIKFGTKRESISYSRPIYKSDALFESEDKNKELKVYINYVISMKNQSTTLYTKVNSIKNYYDKEYKILKVGSEETYGEISNGKTFVDPEPEGDYKNVDINLNDSAYKMENNNILKPQETRKIYIQYEVSMDKVRDLISNNEKTKKYYNVTEVTSYSVYDENGKTYAGIDSDSNPGNAKVEVKDEKLVEDTFEDDTAWAPEFTLEATQEEREIKGKVFLDGTNAELITEGERIGSGKYEDGEKGISGVKIILKENSGSNQIYYPMDEDNKILTTNDEGEFKIKGFIPGEYTLIYIWGDKQYTVENYKGTIWTPENVTEKKENGTSWHKANVVTRYSDAMDDWEKRNIIDNKTKSTDQKPMNAIELVKSVDNTAVINTDYMEEIKNLTNIIVKGIGDVNSDTKINDEDVDVLKKYLMGENPSLTAEQLKMADIDQDGQQTKMDLYYLQRYLEQMESTTNEMDIGVELDPIGRIGVNGLGDVDDNGKVDKQDSTIIQEYISGVRKLNSDELTRADVDQDGVVSILDATFIQRYIARITNFDNEFEFISNDDGTITVRKKEVDYSIKNVDFGIVKRPIQALNLNKRVKNIKIALGKGQTIVDFNLEYDEETGTYKYEEVKGITYIPPSNNTPKNGLIRAELDNELLQGATLYVTYAIKVKNTSEIDYNSKNYYLYGKLADSENEEELIIELKPEKIYDYLDQGFEFNENDNLYEGDQKAWKLTKEESYETSNNTFIEEAYSEYREDTIDAEGNRIEREGYENYRSEYEEIFENWKKETLEVTQYKSKARKYKLDGKNIIELNVELENLRPGREVSLQDLKVSKALASSDEIDLSNDSEVIKISRNQTVGSKLIPSNSVIYDRGEDIRITPPTGRTDNNIELILIIASSLVILGTGIVFIKKKVID